MKNTGFQVTDDDVQIVLRKHGKSTDDVSVAKAIESIDGTKVESAALKANGLDEQTDLAHKEIERQLGLSS